MIIKLCKKVIRRVLVGLHIAGRKRVFILTFQHGSNFGHLLQNFALSEKIKELGYLPKSIAWSMRYLEQPLGYRHNVHINLSYFRKNYIFSTKPIFTEKELKRTIREGRKIIVGGDQVFRKLPFNEEYMGTLRYYGDFVYGTKTLASYAASFGIERFEGDGYLIREGSKLLKRFDRIAVREQSGVEILKHTFGVSGIEVLDPVFLVPINKYNYIIEKAKKLDTSQNGDYIAYMCFGDDHGNWLKNNNIFENKKILRIMFDSRGRFNTVEQWLYNIKNSSFVITNSFHCITFAIIYEKPFIALLRGNSGNNRIENLLNIFNLQHCIKKSIEEIKNSDFDISINWHDVSKIIRERTKISDDYLKEVLDLKPTYKKPYVNWPLRGIRARYEKAYLLRKKAHLKLVQALEALEYKFGFKHRIIRMIIKCLVDRKRYLKLKRDHRLFFQDSKSQFIQFLGRFYN